MTSPIDDVFDNIEAFLQKSREDLREVLRQSQPGNSTIGLSFDPSMVLNYIPSTELVKKGMYDSCDGCLHVEVLNQDTNTGLIQLEVYDEVPAKRFSFIDTSLFLKLFKPASPIKYITGNAGPTG